MGASSYRLLDAANFTTVEGFLQPDTVLKKFSRSRGGFQAAFALYQTNRHQQQHAGKTKTESKNKKTNEN
jgi:hypothetical protein